MEFSYSWRCFLPPEAQLTDAAFALLAPTFVVPGRSRHRSLATPKNHKNITSRCILSTAEPTGQRPRSRSPGRGQRSSPRRSRLRPPTAGRVRSGPSPPSGPFIIEFDVSSRMHSITRRVATRTHKRSGSIRERESRQEFEEFESGRDRRGPGAGAGGGVSFVCLCL